jgi:hypothetical protein
MNADNHQLQGAYPVSEECRSLSLSLSSVQLSYQAVLRRRTASDLVYLRMKSTPSGRALKVRLSTGIRRRVAWLALAWRVLLQIWLDSVLRIPLSPSPSNPSLSRCLIILLPFIHSLHLISKGTMSDSPPVSTEPDLLITHFIGGHCL